MGIPKKEGRGGRISGIRKPVYRNEGNPATLLMNGPLFLRTPSKLANLKVRP